MNKDWKTKIQEDFPFMRQDGGEEGRNTYKRWGFECSGGWEKIIRECCEKIVERYAEDGIDIGEIDFEPTQIKEKLGTLRWYYGYKDSPKGVAAIDCLSDGTSIRFEPGNDAPDDKTKKLRHDISLYVREAEEKSRNICEICGAQGELRNDSDIGIRWVKTLCDACHENSIQKAKK